MALEINSFFLACLISQVWPAGKAIFPDFFKNVTAEVWKDLIIKHHNTTLTFDGLWIVSDLSHRFQCSNCAKFHNYPKYINIIKCLGCLPKFAKGDIIFIFWLENASL